MSRNALDALGEDFRRPSSGGSGAYFAIAM